MQRSVLGIACQCSPVTGAACWSGSSTPNIVQRSSLCAPLSEGNHFCCNLTFKLFFGGPSVYTMMMIAEMLSPRHFLRDRGRVELCSGGTGLYFCTSLTAFSPLRGHQQAVLFRGGLWSSFSSVRKPSDKPSSSRCHSGRFARPSAWLCSPLSGFFFFFFWRVQFCRTTWEAAFSGSGGSVLSTGASTQARGRCQPGLFSLPALLSSYSCS